MISICLATYNGEAYIREQLESIILQVSEGDEIIVSDDGSDDKTLKIIESIHCPLIRIVKNHGERGYAANFENSLRQAKGDFIFISDQDDVWMPSKIKKCMDLLASYDFVVSDAIIVDSDKRVIHPSFYETRGVHRSLAGNIIKFGYLGCCFAFRRKILQKALPLPTNRKYCTHDNWLFLVAKTFFLVKVVDEPLILYRRHSKNTSLGARNAQKSIYFRFFYRLYLAENLVARIFSFQANQSKKTSKS
ncbi:MAG: glycosyltransferase family 2 protein [Bacteroidaceae bacterium]